MSVVFFFPIEPTAMETMGNSLMNPQLRASKCRSLPKAIFSRRRQKTG